MARKNFQCLVIVQVAARSTRAYASKVRAPVGIDESGTLPTTTVCRLTSRSDRGYHCMAKPPRHFGRLRSGSVVPLISVWRYVKCAVALRLGQGRRPRDISTPCVVTRERLTRRGGGPASKSIRFVNSL